MRHGVRCMSRLWHRVLKAQLFHHRFGAAKSASRTTESNSLAQPDRKRCTGLRVGCDTNGTLACIFGDPDWPRRTRLESHGAVQLLPVLRAALADFSTSSVQVSCASEVRQVHHKEVFKAFVSRKCSRGPRANLSWSVYSCKTSLWHRRNPRTLWPV